MNQRIQRTNPQCPQQPNRLLPTHNRTRSSRADSDTQPTTKRQPIGTSTLGPPASTCLLASSLSLSLSLLSHSLLVMFPFGRRCCHSSNRMPPNDDNDGADRCHWYTHTHTHIWQTENCHQWQQQCNQTKPSKRTKKKKEEKPKLKLE